MGVEIERKFLVTGQPWRGVPGVPMVQGYLASSPDVTVRVRVAGDEAFLTVKGPSRGASRAEFEYAVPVADARELLGLCAGRVVEKTRHDVLVGGHVWEIDVFGGANAGLVVAEVELESEDERFERPPWLGAEVTDDRRYVNAALAEHPFGRWGEGT